MLEWDFDGQFDNFVVSNMCVLYTKWFSIVTYTQIWQAWWDRCVSWGDMIALISHIPSRKFLCVTLISI